MFAPHNIRKLFRFEHLKIIISIAAQNVEAIKEKIIVPIVGTKSPYDLNKDKNKEPPKFATRKNAGTATNKHTTERRRVRRPCSRLIAYIKI